MDFFPPQKFADSSPYPPVRVQGISRTYAAEMLSNIGSCNSEMSAISLYIYNNQILKRDFPAFAQCFHKISMVEMQHLDIFSELACLLGADPRLWSYGRNGLGYWSPSCNHYSQKIRDLILNALRGEEDTIRKYKRQMSLIQDCHICDVLRRIILDEEIHVEIFKNMLSWLDSGNPSSFPS